MTFRSDLEAQRIRVESLEGELAALEGRERGLRSAIAEAESRTDVALAKRSRVESWRAMRRRLFFVIFTPIGLVLGGTCLTGGAPLLAWSATHGSADETFSGNVESGAPPLGTPCTVHVEGAGDDCRAQLACGGRSLYAGRGSCTDHGDYWDHAPSRADGTPRCLVSPIDRVAVVDDVPPLHVRLSWERPE